MFSVFLVRRVTKALVNLVLPVVVSVLILVPLAFWGSQLSIHGNGLSFLFLVIGNLFLDS